VRIRATFLLLAALLGSQSPATAQLAVVSAAPDSVEVTVYRDPDRRIGDAMDLDWLNGFALVSERRRVRLPAGESVVRFEGVAGGIVPQSAIVSGFPDGIVERNRDAYLLSPSALLDRSLGRRVHLRRTNSATGEVREQDAVVRSGAAGAVVVQTEEGVEALRCTGLPEAIVYDGVPDGLSAKPTLSVRTRAAAPVDAVVTLSYLATGFDWQANYIADLSPDGRRVDLFAWLTLASTDETSFPNADTQAVAGRVNYTRAQVPPAEGSSLELRCWAHSTTSDMPAGADSEEIVVTGHRGAHFAGAPEPRTVFAVQMLAERVPVLREELGDLKLYRIPEPVTVAANSQKQVALLVQPDVAVEMVFRARIEIETSEEPRPAQRYLVTRNRTQEGLGLPLPSGGVALFTQRQGRRLLIGEGSVDDRSVGDDVEIAVGPSPGILFQLKLIAKDPDSRWTDYLLTATNDQREAVRFEAELERPDDTRITSSVRLGERDGFGLWRATIPANGAATLRYRVESTQPR
jgi:hypothetical protein